jgi:hypothetical protein
MPGLIAAGSADLQVPPAASLRLVVAQQASNLKQSAFTSGFALKDVSSVASCRVLRHARGHLLPAAEDWLDFLAAFVL